MILTFPDTGVLITAFRAAGEPGRRALSVLNDRERRYVSSSFIRLEVLPKALYYRHEDEVQFYRTFFNRVVQWVEPGEAIVEQAHQEAMTYGLSAMDGLHIAAARLAGVQEFITTERRGKPIHRVRGIAIVPIHES